MRLQTWLVMGLIAWLAPLAAGDFIRDFDVRIEVGSDATLDITELITVQFESPRHGIFRMIPVRYERYNNPYTVDLRLKSITDENDNDLRFSRSQQGRDVSFKIGDPDVTITGVHVYRIHYTVRRAINFFSDAPEVYWNVTGDEWPYSIVHAHARLVAPSGTNIASLRHDAFAGPPGSTNHARSSIDSEGLTYSADQLQPGSGLTIVAGLPAGSVSKPGVMQQFLWFVADWWPVPVFPALAVGLVYWRWRKTGRDEGAGSQAIGVEFEPPKDLTPAEVGTLIDETCDTPDVVATLIDLAARGYFTIEEITSERLLYLSQKDYLFHRKPNPPAEKDPLLPHEQRFLEGVFDGDTVTKLSELKYQFYKHIDPMKSMIYRSLINKQLFRANPQTVRSAWQAIGIVTIGGGILLTFILASLGYIAYGVGLILSGIAFLGCASAMPAKTRIGTRKLIECQSFQRFVNMVEKDRIRQMATSDPTIFGRLLPYAMVLGVADQWAEAFRDLTIAAPQWYVASQPGVFNPIIFTDNLGHGMRTMQRTMTSQPASSGSGGSSGWSGGSGFSGGFSGGGFGGGGGGSW